MKKTIYILGLFASLQGVKAQDIHFSQFWAQPLYLNPANAGMFDGDYRVGGIYRNQWRTVPVPYSTISFLGDARFKNVVGMRGSIGAGLIYNNDVSGDSRYTINQIYIPLSYIQDFKNDSNLTVSFGIMPGISNIAFNTGKLTYDSQFDGDGFNHALPTGENYPALSKTYFDIAGGFTAQYRLKGNGNIGFGASLSHINRPGISFFNSNDIRLYAKSTSFVSFKYPIKRDELFVHLDAMYQQQGPFHETLLTGRVSYVLNQKDNINLYAGLSSRLGDAGILLLGMDYKSYRFGFAYDVNYSKFQAATNKRGAWEISLIYILKKQPVFIPKKRSCPVYM